MDPTFVKAVGGTLSRRRSDTRVYSCNTRLIESISEGDTAHIKRMLAMGANPNATCRLNHVSACHIAAMYDNDVLDLLIKAGAESLRSDKLGRTSLHLAAWTGNVKQVAILLNFPEDLREKVATKITPETMDELKRQSAFMHQLANTPCEQQSTPTLPDSWSDGMDHNCKDIKETLPLLEPGWTALHAASARAQHHCVQLLLAAGADPHATDFLLRTPLDIVGCAHYMGHKIDVTNFLATIRILLREGGRLRNPNANMNTPLHTAVELESEEAVEVLLAGGASVTCLNNEGLTAMHVCVQTRHKELLQLLANIESNYEDGLGATIDAKDRFGFTVLRAAVNDGWTQGVYIALGAEASVTNQALDGESPIHAAATLGNMDILHELLTVAKLYNAIDFKNEKKETALFVAIRHNQIGAVKLLVEAGADIGEVLPSGFNVFHEAALHGNNKVLEYLIQYDSIIKEKIINCTDSKVYTPLVYAVLNNHPACVRLLIDNGAEVNLNLDDGEIGKVKQFTTPLHKAARKNYYEIAEIIIKHDIKTIQRVNSTGLLPLHEACCYGNREIVTLLLHNGADLSGSMNDKNYKMKITPIEMLMNNLSKPTDFMEEIFDDYISSQGINIHESNCKVTVNYGILVPNESDTKQMRVIQALLNTGNRFDQNRLLLHPLVQSFIYLKWRVLLPFFYSTLALHACFVLALNVYVVSVFYFKDTHTPQVNISPFYSYSNVWKYIVYTTVCLILIQEIVFIKIKSRKYLLYLETWLKLFSIALVVFLSRVLSWEENTSPEWKRLIATIVLLFTWFEMMYLLSRFPDWGFYVLMFGKVAMKVLKILLSFVSLIFGFSICFMIQFRAKEPFDDLWASFVKTLVMMTSEYDYQSTVTKDYGGKDLTASIIIVRIIFLIFLILVSVVLMNLIVGVAVNDVNYLEMIGNIDRLKKQVEFITSLEDILCHEAFEKVFPKSLLGKWPATLKLKTIIVLWPRKATSSFDTIFPATIKDAIFEKAQLQKKKMDEELGSMVFNIKLDEIHNAVVGNDENDPEYTTATENTLVKIIKRIEKIHADIEVVKDIIVTDRRSKFCNDNSIISQ